MTKKKKSGIGAFFMNMFAKMRAWFVNIEIGNTKHVTVIILAKEIERLDDSAVKRRIQRAAKRAGVEGYLRRTVKAEVERPICERGGIGI